MEIIKKLEVGTNVKFKGLDDPTGVVMGIALEPCPPYRKEYEYYVQWSHGGLGMPSGSSIEEIKIKKNQNNGR
jgi:hypothetical protein